MKACLSLLYMIRVNRYLHTTYFSSSPNLFFLNRKRLLSNESHLGTGMPKISITFHFAELSFKFFEVERPPPCAARQNNLLQVICKNCKSYDMTILGNSLHFWFIARKREKLWISCEKARKMRENFLPHFVVKLPLTPKISIFFLVFVQ